jgi:hypothetical protein
VEGGKLETATHPYTPHWSEEEFVHCEGGHDPGPDSCYLDRQTAVLRLAPDRAPDDVEHEHGPGPACTSMPEFLSTGLGSAFGLLGRQVLLVTHLRSRPLTVVRRMCCSPSNQMLGLLGLA